MDSTARNVADNRDHAADDERWLAGEVDRLREKFQSAATKFVEIEEQLADFFEHSRATDPERRARHLKLALEARQAARHVRMAAAPVDTAAR